MNRKLSYSFIALIFVFLSSCSKDKECVCVTTTTENGLLTSTLTTSRSLNTVVSGPLGNAYEEECNLGDSFESKNNGNVSSSRKTDCELE